ncbi:MAG TPA: hypothetical protein VD997_06830 [Phycisphaerales bacterium]|nr:hypothetical protein [Phycisphaerales bacterium]
MNEGDEFLKKLPDSHKRRLLILRVKKADAEQVNEVLSWGADPNWCTKGGTPAIIRLVRNFTVMADVVEVLLRYGADPNARDPMGLRAIDYARMRLAKFEGKPRKTPRRSPSLTAGGELKLSEREWKFVDRMEATHPGAGEMYLHERRKAAEKVFDNRGNLEKIVAMLEPLAD